jgi:hypothetical protein
MHVADVQYGASPRTGFLPIYKLFFAVFPVFSGRNGFFLDNRDSPYSCTASNVSENGWFDFIDTPQSVLEPWDAAKAARCRTLTPEDARPVMVDIRRSSEDMQAVALRQVLS